MDNIVTNYSERGIVRLELSISMPYGEDFQSSGNYGCGCIARDTRCIRRTCPSSRYRNFLILITLYSLSGHTFSPMITGPVTFEINKRMKAAFHQNGISVAYSEGIELLLYRTMIPILRLVNWGYYHRFIQR
ncbi:MAG: hypothetical protein R2795_11780 [Saprospiraceae bacterium]